MITNEGEAVPKPVLDTAADVMAAVFAPPLPPTSGALCYRTEACSLELLFSGYIGSLIPIAESFDHENQLTSGDIDQVILQVRALREWAISQLSACFYIFPNHDPFFEQQKMPQLIAIRRCDFNSASVMPVGEYLVRLAALHQGFAYDDSLLALSPRLFQVGVSNDPADAGKHFLILPDQKELLLAAKEGVLYPHISASY